MNGNSPSALSDPFIHSSADRISLSPSLLLRALNEKVFKQESASSALKRCAAAQAAQWAMSNRSWRRIDLYEPVSRGAVRALEQRC
jgi:hypothetical protein